MVVDLGADLPDIEGLTFVSWISHGAESDVYLYAPSSHHQRVAVKVFPRPFPEAALRNLRVNADVINRLGHPNHVPILAISTTSHGRAYIVMPFFPRSSLAERLKSGPWTTAATLDLGAHLSAALLAGHQAGLLHGELRPSKILFNTSGVPAVAGFGIGQLLSPAATGGPTLWAAPEVASGTSRPTMAADVYSLAAILWQTVTGNAPSRGLEATVPPPATGTASGGLLQLLTSALAPDPTKRPSLSDILDEFRSLASGVPSQPRPVPTHHDPLPRHHDRTPPHHHSGPGHTAPPTPSENVRWAGASERPAPTPHPEAHPILAETIVRDSHGPNTTSDSPSLADPPPRRRPRQRLVVMAAVAAVAVAAGSLWAGRGWLSGLTATPTAASSPAAAPPSAAPGRSATPAPTNLPRVTVASPTLATPLPSVTSTLRTNGYSAEVRLELLPALSGPSLAQAVTGTGTDLTTVCGSSASTDLVVPVLVTVTNRTPGSVITPGFSLHAQTTGPVGATQWGSNLAVGTRCMELTEPMWHQWPEPLGYANSRQKHIYFVFRGYTSADSARLANLAVSPLTVITAENGGVTLTPQEPVPSLSLDRAPR